MNDQPGAAGLGCRDGSSAFVFDMMEPERPKVDRSILEFAKSHKFHAADFVIRSDGVCRLNPETARCIVSTRCGVISGAVGVPGELDLEL
jgi:hypothetical protein